jgi:hypothetical protein
MITMIIALWFFAAGIGPGVVPKLFGGLISGLSPCNGAPHFVQNLEPSFISCPQCVQKATTITPYKNNFQGQGTMSLVSFFGKK